MDVSATKKWDRVPEGATTPAVSIRLLRNGIKLGEDKVIEPGIGNRTIEIPMGSDMPKYSQDGRPYIYTVIEVNVPKGYAYKQVGTAITNTYDGISEGGTPVQPPIDPTKPFDPNVPANNPADPDPDKKPVTVTATKEWKNVTDLTKVPEIAVRLLRNGQPTGSEKTIRSGESAATWENLPRYAEDSKAYIYTVLEAKVPAGYAYEQRGYQLTNTYDGVSDGGVPEQPPVDPNKPFDPEDPANNPADPDPDKTPRTVVATKEWKNVADITKVPEIAVRLLRDGEDQNRNRPIQGNGTAEWNGLIKYAEDSRAYIYTVAEAEIPRGYSYEQKGYTLTNTYDGVSEGGTPEDPESPVTPDTPNTPDNPFDPELPGNNPTDPNDKNPVTVTATKEWKNVTDLTKVPEIAVRLLRNGQPTGSEKTIRSGESTAEWTGLYRYSEEGAAYIYTVSEVSIPRGYAYEQKGYTLTNTYDGISEGGKPIDPKNPVDPGAPEPFDPEAPDNNPTDPGIRRPVTVRAEKKWRNMGGPRKAPEISIGLKQSGAEYGTPIVLRSGEKTAEWKDLPRFAPDASEYEYTVYEVEVPFGYDMSQNGNVIINRRLEENEVPVNAGIVHNVGDCFE